LDDLSTILKVGPCKKIRAEAWGLRCLGSVEGVRAPEVIDSWSDGGKGFLMMEHIPSRSAKDMDMARLGEMVARLHGQISDKFGAETNNFIGSLHQDNTPVSSWADFWWGKRIGPQLDLAKSNGYDLLKSYPDIETKIRSSRIVQEVDQGRLLHGDLWNGNYLIHGDGTPFLIDPCPYYGDPRVDLAMTRLFGGFGPTFYEAYTHNADPELDFNEEVCQFYQLYFLLNHLNMFGTGYLGGVKTCLNGLR
jgi:fructosamine-3-kinase